MDVLHTLSLHYVEAFHLYSETYGGFFFIENIVLSLIYEEETKSGEPMGHKIHRVSVDWRRC